MRKMIALPLLSGLLAACASAPDSRFPSLSKRAYEDAAERPQTPSRPTAQSLTESLAARIAPLEQRIGAAQRAFSAALPAMRTRAASASGSRRSSEAWVDAHLKLSRLDKLRADGVAALAELDRLIVAQMDAELTGEGPLYGPLLQVRQKQMAATIDAQSEEIERLGRIVGY